MTDIKQRGFTIVELLIVVVIIAVIAAITIVAYNGIQNRANDAAVQSDLRSIGGIISNYIAINGGLPTTNIETTLMNDVLGSSTMKTKTTKGAYDLTTQAAPGDPVNTRNLLVCISGGTTNPQWGVGALSKSGSVFFYTSQSGLVKDNTQWIGQQTTQCPKLGISLSASGYARTFGYERVLSAPVDSGWKAWAQ